VKGSNQRLVVCKDDKTTTLQHITEMADGSHYLEEFAVKRAVVDLGFIQLCRKEAQRLPRLPWPPLLDGGAYVGSRSVCDERNLCFLGWVY
jgi:hypothetical protein